MISSLYITSKWKKEELEVWREIIETKTNIRHSNSAHVYTKLKLENFLGTAHRFAIETVLLNPKFSLLKRHDGP